MGASVVDESAVVVVVEAVDEGSVDVSAVLRERREVVFTDIVAVLEDSVVKTSEVVFFTPERESSVSAVVADGSTVFFLRNFDRGELALEDVCVALFETSIINGSESVFFTPDSRGDDADVVIVGMMSVFAS